MTGLWLACENPALRGAEIDVCLTSDGYFVLNHGNEINDTPVNEMTFEQVRAHHIANGEIVPTLDEALDLLGKYPDRLLMLDLKFDSDSTYRFADHVKGYPHLDQLIFKSFSTKHCRLLNESGIDNVYLLTWDINEVNVEQCKIYGIDGISAYFQPVEEAPQFIKRLKDYGFKLAVWTLDRQSQIDKFVDLGVDFVVCDWSPDME